MQGTELLLVVSNTATLIENLINSTFQLNRKPFINVLDDGLQLTLNKITF